MKKRFFTILLNVCILSSVSGQNKETFISFPKGVHPGMSSDEVKKIDSNLVQGSGMNPDKTWIKDTLSIYDYRQTVFYYSKDTLQGIYWEFDIKSLDVNERQELIDASLKQISFFIEIYGKPTITILNAVPDGYLRQWRDIVKAVWQTPYGTITVHLRYLTRVFEDPAEIEDGTYDREFDLRVSYGR